MFVILVEAKQYTYKVTVSKSCWINLIVHVQI